MKMELQGHLLWLIVGGGALFAVMMSAFSIIYRKKHPSAPKRRAPSITPRSIKIECPKCGQRYEADSTMDGELVPCQKCGYEFVIHDPTPRAVPTKTPPAMPPGCMRCPVCGGMVAKTAQNCPHCGAVIPKVKDPFTLGGIVEAIFIFFGFPILAGFVMVLFVPPLFYGLAILAFFVIWIILIVSRCKSR